jgi:hypothetical protein
VIEVDGHLRLVRARGGHDEPVGPIAAAHAALHVRRHRQREVDLEASVHRMRRGPDHAERHVARDHLVEVGLRDCPEAARGAAGMVDSVADLAPALRRDARERPDRLVALGEVDERARRLGGEDGRRVGDLEAIDHDEEVLERDAPAIGERDVADRIAHGRGLFAAHADDDGARRLCAARERQRERDGRAEEEAVIS